MLIVPSYSHHKSFPEMSLPTKFFFVNSPEDKFPHPYTSYRASTHAFENIYVCVDLLHTYVLTYFYIAKAKLLS